MKEPVDVYREYVESFDCATKLLKKIASNKEPATTLRGVLMQIEQFLENSPIKSWNPLAP